MLKVLLIALTLSTSAQAMISFNLPSLDFDMAERAILNSEAIQNAEADLNTEAVDVEKIGKKTYRVTFASGCDLTAKFGKRSKVYVVPESFFCN
jgi:hypothetical protein